MDEDLNHDIIKNKVVLINDLIKLRKFDEALNVYNNLEYKSDELISLKIKILTEQGKYKEAERLCLLKRFKNNYKVISQRIKILMRQEKLEEALAVAQKYQSVGNIQIITQQINVLIKLRRFKEALELCEYGIFYESKHILSEKVKILMIMKKYDEAIEICDSVNSEEMDEPVFIAQKISILIRQAKFEEALMVCNDERYKDNPEIISKKISTLIAYNKYEEALSLANLRCFKYDPRVLNKKLTCLINLGKYDEALELCDNEMFCGIMFIEGKRNMINNLKEKNNKDVSLLMTKVYFDDTSVEEIENAIIPIKAKCVLLGAYYEKHVNERAKGIKKFKAIKEELKKDKEKNKKVLKAVNIVFERLQNKKTQIFDVFMYTNLLNTTVDFDYKKEDKKEIIEIKKEVIDPIKKEEADSVKEKIENKTKEEKNIFVQTGKRQTRENTNLKPTPINVVKEEKVLLKDMFSEEIFSLASQIYVLMNKEKTQKKACEAWDRLEVLINKEATSENISRILDLFKRTYIMSEEEVKKYVK